MQFDLLAQALVCLTPTVCMLLLGTYVRWTTN